MVFESLVTDLMNKYLGDFIENLNKSQLKIGIWGGDVVLNNLNVKQSALDELDLPVKVLYGNVGKLTLKIPWKNLYTEPVVATLDGLYVVAAPNVGVKYNAEKEERAAQEAKQKELARIEEQKKLAEKSSKDAENKDDTFAEKLATQVIKNLQVNVSNIHIRYEDHHTNPAVPFSVGVTLNKLSFETTDEFWKPTIIKQTVTNIFKMVKLDGLALYWNAQTKPILKLDREEILDIMKRTVRHTHEYQYLIEPISASAQLRINTKPEKEKFSLPKFFVNVIFEQISLSLEKKQYHNILELLESFERMAVAGRYRKYRPNVPKKGHAKEWWQFANNCILETTVRRKRQMWSPEFLNKHIRLRREYKENYKKKLQNKKPPQKVLDALDSLEKELTVFQITLLRQQAETEAKKEGVKKSKERSSSGWLGGWFGGSKKSTATEDTDISDKFNELMDAKEKQKLYEAIGYQENTADPTLPVDYVAYKLHFNLRSFNVIMKDSKLKTPEIMKLQLTDVYAGVGQRPAANAVSVSSKMDSFTVYGSQSVSGGIIPTLIDSQNKIKDQRYALVDTLVETNPLDGSCDTRVSLTAHPIRIVYDAHTINQLVDFVKPPESVFLKQLQAAAMAKFEELKEQTATSLQHTIDTHKYTCVNIEVKPSYLIIPDKGVYHKEAAMMVLDMGCLKVGSEKQNKAKHSLGNQSTQLEMDEVKRQAYDKFTASLTSVQLIYSPAGHDWQSVRELQDSKMHILKPMELKFDIFKSILEDVKLPKTRIHGVLPCLSLTMSDARLQEILQLVASIPLPSSGEEPVQEELDVIMEAPEVENLANEGNAEMLLKKIPVYDDSDSDSDGAKSVSSGGSGKSRSYVNMTDLEAEFEISEINLSLAQRQKDEDIPMLKFVIEKIGTKVQMKTFDMVVNAYLGGIYLQHTQFKAPEGLENFYPHLAAAQGGPLVNLINTPSTDGSDRLLTLEYIQANKKGPYFESEHKKTMQRIKVHFKAFEFLLHQEALLNLIEFGQNLQKALEAQSADLKQSVQEVKTAKRRLSQMSGNLKVKRPSETRLNNEYTQARKARLAAKEPDVIDIAVEATLDVFSVAVCTSTKLVTDIKIKGLEAHVKVLKAKTCIEAVLKDITIYDTTPDALYPKILSTEGQKGVIQANIVAYNGGTDMEKYLDMSCVDVSIDLNVGTTKIVFLNKFVADVLKFVDKFQTAKDKMMEASTAAAAQAAQAAAAYSEKANRISFNIELQAPVIIVPRSSKCTSALVLDLGLLTITNSFHKAAAKDSQGNPAIMDKMVIALRDLKMSRAKLKGLQIMAECLMLEPVHVTLNLNRNLTFSWYKAEPEMEIVGKLAALTVTISQGDFNVMMGVLSENLTEGALPPPAKAAEKTVESKVEGEKEKEGPGTQALVSPGTDKKAAEAVHSKMKFDFKIESLKAELFDGLCEPTAEKSQRLAEKSLGKFEIHLIAVSGDMKEDNSMNAKVFLTTCVLDDTRPGREKGITRMVERNTSKIASEKTNMIELDFSQTAEGESIIDTSVNGLYICVCLEYLMTLADFFVKGMPENKPTQTVSTVSTSGATSRPVESTPVKSTMKLTLTVMNPEIVLVEDAMNTDTNAIILDMQVDFKMLMSPEVQKMSGSVEGLTIISAKFAQEKRKASKSNILAPTSVNLHSTAPYGKGHHMDLAVSDIQVNISPHIIRVLTATLSSLSTQSNVASTEEKSPVPKDLWAVKKIDDCEFWYIKQAVEHAEVKDPLDDDLVQSEMDAELRREQLLISVKKITLRLEGGVGKRTVPLLITEMTFQSQINDWSTKFSMVSDISMEVAYYNELKAVWEPLVEPVEAGNHHRPWELNVEVKQNEDFPPPAEEDEGPHLPPPKMTVNIKSLDILQTTLTKTCIEVLTNLGKAFGDAYNLVEVKEEEEGIQTPYYIKNDSGLKITIKLDPTFVVPEKSQDGEHIILQPGERIGLKVKENRSSRRRERSVIKNTQEDIMKRIVLMLEEFGVTRELKIVQAEKRAFSVNKRAYPGDFWLLVSQIDVSYGCKTVTFRSCVQVFNELPCEMEVYYKLGNESMGKCGTVKPNERFNVPLEAVYAAPYELYFKPVNGCYKETSSPYIWKDLKSGVSCVLECASKDSAEDAFYFKVNTTTKNILYESTTEHAAQIFTLNLKPAVVFRNQLPFAVEVSINNSSKQEVVPRGDYLKLFHAKLDATKLSIAIPNYQGKKWVGTRLLETTVDEFTVWTFETVGQETVQTMDLGLHCDKTQGNQVLNLYCPYWMINKTGRNLEYRGSDEFTVSHPSDEKDVVLFSFKSKAFFAKKKEEEESESSKKGTLSRQASLSSKSGTKKRDKVKKLKKKSMKASLRVGESEWSDKFSLDTVGSQGTVTCKFKNYQYEVGVDITLASSGLTKILVFTPYYILMNQASYPITVSENIPDSHIWEVGPNDCIPFWPTQTGKKLQMIAEAKDAETLPFYYTEPHRTLLKLDNELGGVNVSCEVMEATIQITFDEYKPGFAAVQLVNHTDKSPVEYYQVGMKEQKLTLNPGETVLYSWQNPIGKTEFIWSCGEQKERKDDLVKDGIGEFFDGDNKCYWVSFLDGMQRVLLFTEDLALATVATQAGELERLDQEINICLFGMGLSLVNNVQRKELAYMSISNSGVIWEEKKKKRFKALKNKYTSLLEDAYQKYQLALQAGQNPNGKMTLDTKFEVDFGANPILMLKPHKTEIRRSFEDGVWIQYRTSPHQLQFHAKIHRLQLDSQMPGAVFNTVLTPVPPPKSVVADSVPKPFTEVSVMLRKKEFSQVMQFKYAKILIQEMAVKVDQMFLNGLVTFFSFDKDYTDEQKVELFQTDCKAIDSKLIDEAMQTSSDEQKNYYDMLHFSPLKVHVSFSMYQGGEKSEDRTIHNNVLNVFLSSVGIVLTDIQDVIFKLGYFERKYRFYNQSQLTGEITRHYSQQAIKQMYVLVLGLDVLGNPFGLIRGIAEGIEDLFYEPYQGAIQGPEEFAEGLALGVRSLFGHAVGGAAGAVSRITGALGKGIATLTLDDEYQKKRREQMSKRPTDFKEGLARGGKGLVMGVVDGVTGIVTKPVQGAKQEGVEGFFKGMGKGLVGVFTRPASGVVDFASSSFEGIRRVAENTEEIRRFRPPRYLHLDGIVRPYNHREAEGNDILMDVEKGKYASTDFYKAHVIVTADLKNVLLVTDNRVIFCVKGEIFGHWDCDWQYTWHDLKEPPTLTKKGIQILLKEKQKKSFFSSGTVGKLIPIADERVAQWIVEQMSEAMAKSK